MATYIIIGISLSLLLAFSAWEIFRSKELHGTTSKEWFENQYNYQLKFLFRTLPAIRFGKRQLGSVGSLLFFFVLVPFTINLLASVADGTLFGAINEKGIYYRGFLEGDYVTLPSLFVVAATTYLFRKFMDVVPKTLCSIPINISGETSKTDKVEECLHKIASVLFLANNATGAKRVNWGRMIEMGLAIVLAGLIIWDWSREVYIHPDPGLWNTPDHFWGNMFGIIYSSILCVYFARILIGYSIRLIWGMWYLGHKLGELLRIEPLDPDGAGGLSEFGKLAGRIDLALLPSVIFLVYWFLVWDKNPGFVGAVSIGIMLIPIFFFFPLWGLHKAMDKAKHRELKLLSSQFNWHVSTMKQGINTERGIETPEALKAQEVLERVILLHQRASRMPVWPFDHITLTRVFLYVVLPVALVVIGKIL